MFVRLCDLFPFRSFIYASCVLHFDDGELAWRLGRGSVSNGIVWRIGMVRLGFYSRLGGEKRKFRGWAGGLGREIVIERWVEGVGRGNG